VLYLYIMGRADDEIGRISRIFRSRRIFAGGKRIVFVPEISDFGVETTVF